MSKIAVFPGSFDPITKGHVDLVRRSLSLFDEVVVAIGVNTEKKYLFPLEQRKAWITQVFAAEPKVKVMHYEGLTVNFCNAIHADFILRGLRSSIDYEFERSIAQMNKAMNPKIETVFILSDPTLSAISSTIVREIIRTGGDVSAFVPEGVEL